MLPNILWIQTDEHRPDSLGCYGSAWARTPALDALARSGTRFENAVCQSPVCVPSRTSQLTARYPQEVNCLGNEVGESEIAGTANAGVGSVLPAGTMTFPQHFAQHGYQTASFGKIHTPKNPTWQLAKPLVNDTTYAGYFGLAPGFDETQHRVLRPAGGSPIIIAGTYPNDADTPSKQVTDWAIEWLEHGRDSNRPFLLRISHNWPHTPVLPPPPYDRIYDAVALPVRGFDRVAYETRSAWDREMADVRHLDLLTDAEMEHQWKSYMGLCAYVDLEVGRAITALERCGLRENTIIVFSADHGKALGEWGAGEKGFFDQEVWRVPFVWSWPGRIPENSVRTSPCELLDTAVTLSELAGVEPHPSWRGRDLFGGTGEVEAVFGQIGWPRGSWHRGASQGRIDPSEGVAFDADPNELRGANRPARSVRSNALRVAVRTRDFRMDETWMKDGVRIQPDQADGNLFDLREDPEERWNLWSTTKHEATRRQLRALLHAWFERLDRPVETFGPSGRQHER
ncbi:MAG: sulfatase-like hydrolase/transferase [Actinomycetota bacterium]|nr:sulfatase-like hydrolase/transferase [Actinomycetota bacterium]